MNVLFSFPHRKTGKPIYVCSPYDAKTTARQMLVAALQAQGIQLSHEKYFNNNKTPAKNSQIAVTQV